MSGLTARAASTAFAVSTACARVTARVRSTAIGVFTACALLTACGGVAPAPAPEEGADGGRATVVRVIDGDTVELAIGVGSERVRLLGVDAPESVARNVPEQCFGAEASAALAELLPAGAEVLVSRDVEPRDHYDRLLLYLHVEHEGELVFVNEWLVATGLAEAVSYEPNTAHRAVLHRAQRHATDGRLGLWAQCDGPDQPLDPTRPPP